MAKMPFPGRKTREESPSQKEGEVAKELGTQTGEAPMKSETSVHSGVKPVSTARPKTEPLADDLMQRVTKAMDEWARANGLSNLPQKVIFQQVLSIMNAFYKNIYEDL